jgi:thiosulfate dehydrogenase
MSARRILWACLALLVSACSPGPTTAVKFGEQLFNDTRFAESRFNAFSCATCHATREGDPRVLAGYPMLGVTRRPSYWGGYQTRLIDSASFCYVYFMRGPGELDPSEPRSKALYEYLDSLPGDGAARPLTIVKTISDRGARGDPTRGEAVYKAACQGCHGQAHSGAGRISDAASILPEVSSEYPTYFPKSTAGEVFTEKVRHGQFFGVGGNMPLFSREALSDEDLAALLAYLGV